MEKYVKFRIIGCGHIGKRHAIVIGAANTAGLVSLCNIEVEKDDDLVGFEINKVSTDYHELINSSVDVVSTCTPHFLHKPISIDALQAVKDVIVQKPMALSTDDAEEMTSTANDLNRNLYVVKQNRFNLPIRLAGDAIANNG